MGLESQLSQTRSFAIERFPNKTPDPQHLRQTKRFTGACKPTLPVVKAWLPQLRITATKSHAAKTHNKRAPEPLHPYQESQSGLRTPDAEKTCQSPLQPTTPNKSRLTRRTENFLCPKHGQCHSQAPERSEIPCLA